MLATPRLQSRCVCNRGQIQTSDIRRRPEEGPLDLRLRGGVELDEQHQQYDGGDVHGERLEPVDGDPQLDAGGGVEVELPKTSMTATASKNCDGWGPSLAADESLVAPGWHNNEYTGNAWLRVDLGSRRTVSKVSYPPRQMDLQGDL